MNGRERFLAAIAGRPVDRPPVWLMRQAGRYLPEYRAVRERYPFEAMVARPDIAAEVTLQPLRRFDLDAAVIFSDILVPLAAMGHPARFVDGGPVVDPPVRAPADVDKLRTPEPGETSKAVSDTIQQVVGALPDKAVVGFAAAPFTLAAYLVEGRGSKDFAATKTFAYRHPEAFDRLLAACGATLATHLEAQIEAGAHALQIFDTWAEALSPREYTAWELPHVRQLVARVRRVGRPVIYFARGTAHLLPHLRGVASDAYSVDWRVDLRDVRRHIGDAAIQGNLDPTVLFAPPKVVEEETRLVLEQGAEAGRHVMNLGHGLLPATPIESVEALVGTVKGWRG